MEFNATVSDLHRVLSLVSPAVASRTSHPVLVCFLLEADKDRQTLKVTGYDLNLGIQISFHAPGTLEVNTGGSCLVSAEMLAGILSRQEGDQVLHFVAGEKQHSLTVRRSRYTLGAMPVADYPEFSASIKGVEQRFNARELSRHLKQVAFAISTDPTKQVLTAACYNQVTAQIAATDGHRLAVERVDVPTVEDGTNVLIPSSTVVRITKILDDADPLTEAILVAGAEELSLRVGNISIYSRALSGQYPNYNQLIPTRFEREWVFDRKKLVNALLIAALTASKKNNVVVLNSSAEGVTITCESEADSVCEWIDGQITGTELSIAFNQKYLIEALKAWNDAAEVLLQLNGPHQPVIVKPVDGSSEYLLMPVQVRS